MYGYIKVGAAAPLLKVADCIYNAQEIINQIQQAQKNNVKILVFPELCITAYTCGDLFLQTTLLESAEKSLSDILNASCEINMLIALGLPILSDNQCFNCSVMIYQGKIIGCVPKTYLPNYSEFYEKRWFCSGANALSDEITICGQKVPFGTDLLFYTKNIPGLMIGVEICEDLWAPIAPSSYQAICGATLILNLSASNELAAKYQYRKDLVAQQSSRLVCGYVYASAGIGESTQDMVFSGHSMIYENGALLKESKRFQNTGQLILSDIDLELLKNDRKKTTTFMSNINKQTAKPFRKIKFLLEDSPVKSLDRAVEPHPFIPKNNRHKNQRCEDIFHIQVTGLSKRFAHTKAKNMIIGISGGLDSTLALLVCVKACDFLGIDRSHVIGVTMPGFGTTDRTYQNALNLMKALKISTREVSIKDACLQHFKDIGHDPSVHDVTYENTQARERTQILMDIANKEWGIVIGTGDLSELALGWATYNGDHMSMYGVNGGIPKTLVQVLVRWVAEHDALEDTASEILLDVLDTPVSPELLPPDQNGKIEQKTEEIVGPYELHDFFLYYVVRFGFTPEKILFLALTAFKGKYERKTILKWLKNFYIRFFTQQFKRSCLPDGPKVGTINLSPRGDWRMPSDASSRIWLEELERLI